MFYVLRVLRLLKLVCMKQRSEHPDTSVNNIYWMTLHSHHSEANNGNANPSLEHRSLDTDMYLPCLFQIIRCYPLSAESRWYYLVWKPRSIIHAFLWSFGSPLCTRLRMYTTLEKNDEWKVKNVSKSKTLNHFYQTAGMLPYVKILVPDTPLKVKSRRSR